MKAGSPPCAKRWDSWPMNSTRRWPPCAGASTPWPSRYRPAAAGDAAGLAQFTEHHPGELLAALERAERRALYCQSLVSTFVQSARDAYPGAALQTVSAASLVNALLDEFPFEEGERGCVGSDTAQDFSLPGRRDLLYLVLCTLTKNALLALRGCAQPVAADRTGPRSSARAGRGRGCASPTTARASRRRCWPS